VKLPAIVARRILDALVVLLVVSALAFLAMNVSGDPVALMLDPAAPASERDALRRELGLDRPLLERYARFVADAVRGDFGRSLRYNDSALRIVLERLPATMELAAVVIVTSFGAALLAAVLSLAYPNTWLDRGIQVMTAVGPAVPAFWLGVILIELLAVQWQVLPTSGRGSWAQLIMPGICLALNPWARLTRMLRATIRGVLWRPFIDGARARGVAGVRLWCLHVGRNALTPLVSELGTQTALLLGGAAIVESIFAWPGIGQLTIQSIGSRDYPLVQAIVLSGAVLVVLVNLISDLVQLWLDPAVRSAS
jgi:peptide/nickel transport system permease protein